MYTPLSSSYCKPFQIYVVKKYISPSHSLLFESAFVKEKTISIIHNNYQSIHLYFTSFFHSCVVFPQICQFFTSKIVVRFQGTFLDCYIGQYIYSKEKRNFYIGDEYMGEAILVKREPLWTKEFVALILANLCMFLGFQMLIPTLPVYVKEIGGTSSNIGFVVGMFTVAALFVRPLTGNALQKFSKKIILMIGTAICLLAMGSYLFASTVFLLLAVRILHGAGFGITTTTYGTVVSDLIPQARRGEGMGYFGLSGTIAMALGPLIGLWLMQTYNFTILFLCALSCTIVSLILTKLLQIKKSPQPPKQTSGTFLDGFIERKALLPSLLILCITLMYGGIGSFITLFATEVGIADISLFLFNALAIAVTRPFSGKLYDAKGHSFVIIPGVIITFAGIILLSYTTTIPSLIIAAACYGSGFGAIQPALQAWMIDRVAPHRRGVATATFFSAFDLGIGAGAIIFGFIAHFTNCATVYRYSSLLLIAFLFIYITSVKKQKHGDKNTEKAAG